MKRKLAWLILSCIMALSMVLASCGGDAGVAEEEEEEVVYENWWDVFGEPEYGDTLTIRVTAIDTSPDPWESTQTTDVYDRLFIFDWTLDRDIWSFKLWQAPSPTYWGGGLVESWEWTDPQTLVCQIREGVHWQDKAPVNGRELTAEDIVEPIEHNLRENLLGHLNGLVCVGIYHLEPLKDCGHYPVTQEGD